MIRTPKTGTPAHTAGRHTPVVPLHDVLDDLDRIIEDNRENTLTLAELEDLLRGRGVALLIIVLSLPFIVPVPIPLLATVCGLPIIALGLTIALTGQGVLPRFVRRRQLSPAALAGVAKGARKILRPMARAFRPRLGVMFWAVPWRLAGVSIVLAAFVLSLPIPVPFANMIPALGLIHIAAGMLQRDGLAVCVGHAFTLGSYAYLFVVWDTVWGVVSTWLN
ncbi:MAG: exopolysaccharide biosynthesis protein [Phycisphaerales bacterium JB040]